MEDYKEIVREMLRANFGTTGTKSEFMSTSKILNMVRGIIPTGMFDEDDLFSLLKEEGYQYKLNTFASTIENDKGEEIVSNSYVFLWQMFPIAKK